jgi:hypothetical protein
MSWKITRRQHTLTKIAFRTHIYSVLLKDICTISDVLDFHRKFGEEIV